MTTPPDSSLPAGVSGFFAGLAYPLRGIRFLFGHRELWPYAALPALVNGLVVLVLALIAFHQFDAVFAWIQPDLLEQVPADAPWWKTFWRPIANGLLGFVVSVLLIGASILGGLLTGAILAGPFQEKLSEVVESVATGRPPPDEPLSLRTLSTDVVRAVRSAVQRFALFLAFYVPLLMISLIPVVGLVGVAGTAVYSAFFLALNFADPTLERRKLPLGAKLGWARASLAPWMGFGAGLLGLMLIPLLGLVLAPAFVTAGTLLCLDVAPNAPEPSEPS
jgi:CysZ protein